MTELEEMAKKFSPGDVEKSSNILDLDEVAPEPRIIKLKKERIDVSQIPTGITLKMIQFYDQMKGGDLPADEAIDKILEIFGKFCEKRNPKATKEFLLENLPIEKLTAFVNFIIEPVIKHANVELDELGNLEAAK